MIPLKTSKSLSLNLKIHCFWPKEYAFLFSSIFFFGILVTSIKAVDFRVVFTQRDLERRMDQAVLDDIINRLLEVRGRPGKQVQLSESEIRLLCVFSKEIFLQQPNLLDLEAPIKICGIFFSIQIPNMVAPSFLFYYYCREIGFP